jgi:hypothetical protein
MHGDHRIPTLIKRADALARPQLIPMIPAAWQISKNSSRGVDLARLRSSSWWRPR